jgi:hypothetical protein
MVFERQFTITRVKIDYSTAEDIGFIILRRTTDYSTVFEKQFTITRVKIDYPTVEDIGFIILRRITDYSTVTEKSIYYPMYKG